MNNSIDTLRKNLKLSTDNDENDVSRVKTQLIKTVREDKNISGRRIWRAGKKQHIIRTIKDATDKELADIVDTAQEVSEKKTNKKKQKIEKRIKKPTNSLMPSIGLLAGGLALGGFALAAQNMMPRQVTPLPLMPSMFPMIQLNNNIHNQAERNISAMMPPGLLKMAMATAGVCLVEAIRPKTPEELEQKEQTRVKLLCDKNDTLLNSNSKAYDDIKNDTAYKNLIVSREVNRFFDTENIDLIQNDESFTIKDEADFNTKIQEIITSDDDTADKAGIKALYQEFENLPKMRETSSSKEELQKHFIDKLFKKILYNKLRDSFISGNSLDENAQAKAPYTFDKLMNNNYLKKMYLNTLLSADSKEEFDNNIYEVINNSNIKTNIQDLSADNLKDKLPELLALFGDGACHKDNTGTSEAIIKLLALNHANNLLDKNDSTYKIIKDNKHLFFKK